MICTEPRVTESILLPAEIESRAYFKTVLAAERTVQHTEEGTILGKQERISEGSPVEHAAQADITSTSVARRELEGRKQEKA